MAIISLIPEPLRRINKTRGPMSAAQAARLQASSMTEAVAWMAGLGWTRAQAWTWLAWAGGRDGLGETMKASRAVGLNPAAWIPMVFAMPNDMIEAGEGLGLNGDETKHAARLVGLRSSSLVVRDTCLECLEQDTPAWSGEALSLADAAWRMDRSTPLDHRHRLHALLFSLDPDWERRWLPGAERLLTMAGWQFFSKPLVCLPPGGTTS